MRELTRAETEAVSGGSHEWDGHEWDGHEWDGYEWDGMEWDKRPKS